MRKIFTLLAISFITTLQVGAQCSDLSSYTSAGIYPDDALDFCDQATANQDLVIVVNEDTTVFGFSASVDRVQIDDITNLPNGLTYSCGSANCEYFPSDGLLKICITFSGNVNDASYGTDSPVITGDLDYTIAGGGSGSLPNETLPYNFEFTVLPTSDASCNTTSTTVAHEDLMSVYPNPVSATGILNVSEASNIEIVDFLGNEIYSGTVSSSIDLSQFNLNSGVYFIRANNHLGQFTKKFVVK